MGRNSGGVVHTGGGGANAAIVVQAVQNSRSISTIKDRSVVKELQRGISRFESVLGIRERDVRIADLDKMNALGVTWIGPQGESAGILLNAKFFDIQVAMEKVTYSQDKSLLLMAYQKYKELG